MAGQAGKSFILRQLGEKSQKRQQKVSPRSSNGRTESFEKTLLKAAKIEFKVI